MAEGDGAEHDVLGQLLRLGFHHQHAFRGAGDHQVELAVFNLRGGRVEDVLAVVVADAGGGDRAEERDAGQRQRGRAADQGDDVGVVLQVVAEHGGDDLDLVAEALGEQRADRAVDQAGLQDLGLGRAAFALEEAAGDLAGGERLLLVVHGQREEILAGPGGFHADGGAQHDGVAVAGQHGAVGLAGDLAGFQDQLAAAPVEFLAEVVEHAVVLRMRAASADGMPCDLAFPCRREAASRVAWRGLRRAVGAAAGHVAGNAVAVPAPVGACRIGGLSVRRVMRRWEALAGPHGVAPPHHGAGVGAGGPHMGALAGEVTFCRTGWARWHPISPSLEGGGWGEGSLRGCAVRPLPPTPSLKGRGRIAFPYRRRLSRPISVS